MIELITPIALTALISFCTVAIFTALGVFCFFTLIEFIGDEE